MTQSCHYAESNILILINLKFYSLIPIRILRYSSSHEIIYGVSSVFIVYSNIILCYEE